MFESLFGAEKITLHSAGNLEQNAPNIIVWAAPIMFFFVLLEYIVSRWQNRKYYDRADSIGATLVGLGNVVIGLFLKTVILTVLIVIYNWVPWRMHLNWYTFLPCYILFDFCSYWAHNMSHRLRFLWATHVPHHSSEHYNLTVSFRLSWVQYIKIIFFLPVSFIGFHPVIIFVTNQIAVLFQFWVHTEYIKKLHPVIEYVFATPSNHRVHHGSQERYINKNYGATFIIWDRIFGTFQKEDEKPVYGLTHNIDRKHDPIHINFHEYVDIIKDVKTASNWKEALFYIFGDPGDIDLHKKTKARMAMEQNSERVLEENFAK